MLDMVALSMPQFLVYTIPFATLSASSMVLGDLSSTNELLAIRSCGIPSKYIYRPLILISLIMSVITFIFADVIHPLSSIKYRDKLAYLMAEMPTFELESNSTNTVGSYVISNGKTDGRDVYDLLLMSKGEKDNNKTVLSEHGELELIDPSNYIYSLTLDKPQILLNSTTDLSEFGLSSAEKATFYLDFSDQIPSLTSNSPVNLTSRELYEAIKKRDAIQSEDRASYNETSHQILLSLSSSLKRYMDNEESEDTLLKDLNNANISYSAKGSYPVNFYGQYYKAELAKKFVLSLSCFFLTLITLPLSNMKVKYGKLTGFAISLLVAVAFWYMLFGVQLEIFSIKSSPYLLIALPDLIIGAIAAILLVYFRKAR